MEEGTRVELVDQDTPSRLRSSRATLEKYARKELKRFPPIPADSPPIPTEANAANVAGEAAGGKDTAVRSPPINAEAAAEAEARDATGGGVRTVVSQQASQIGTPADNTTPQDAVGAVAGEAAGGENSAAVDAVDAAAGTVAGGEDAQWQTLLEILPEELRTPAALQSPLCAFSHGQLVRVRHTQIYYIYILYIQYIYIYI